MAFNTAVIRKLKYWEVVVVLLIFYCLVLNHRLIFFAAVADDAVNLTSLAYKRAAAGFISIDCGLTGDSRLDELSGLYFSSDTGFVNTGRNMEVDDGYRNNVQPVHNTLRSFPDGKRNCYTFKPLQGKNNSYLIRARFLYGNYDGLNTVPEFNLFIGVNFWTKVNLDNVNSSRFSDIVYTPLQDLIYVCLVKTGSTTPFISALELKPLNNSIYKSSAGALRLRESLDAGLANNSYSSPADDPYDRYWRGVPASFKTWGSVKTDISMNSTFTDPYNLPPSVLQTATIPVPSNVPLNYSVDTYDYYTGLICLYWHFAEIERTNGSREFTISIPGNFESGVISPKYMQPLTIVSPPVKLINGSLIEFFITKTKRSEFPPILNALEIFEVVDLSAFATHQDDADAIIDIKMNYSVPMSWQGDPCLPSVALDGLNCSKNGSGSPRIISLNLALSGLVGNIPHSLSALTALTYLNLSYNNLTGAIPDFLAEMPSLHTIDLRSNRLIGPIPITLSKKAEDGSIKLSLDDNPDLCMSNPCKKKNSKKMVVVLAATASITFIFTTMAVLFCIMKRKKPAKYIKNASHNLENRGFTYIEVKNMTNNFQVIIGKGGSGSVYQGSLQDGTLVAVKLLNPSSTYSLKLFRNEAELLTRVHHRNLVSLIGYCEEGESKALIYEFVSNGNLQQYLSDNNVKVLCWTERLQIAIDAAHGLEYLHNGCRPPIVHRDIKISNILLDENWHAKISDFGISKTFSTENTESDLITNVMGTHGYVDPEYYSTQRLNKKSDVYSFGVVLLELITGYPAIIRGCGQPIHIIAWTTPKLESGDIENIVDKRLQGHFSSNSAWKALEIAMTCVSLNTIQRPSMDQVLIDLNDCLAIEIAYERNRRTDDHEIAIADTSIEIGPSAR